MHVYFSLCLSGIASFFNFSKKEFAKEVVKIPHWNFYHESVIFFFFKKKFKIIINHSLKQLSTSDVLENDKLIPDRESN